VSETYAAVNRADRVRVSQSDGVRQHQCYRHKWQRVIPEREETVSRWWRGGVSAVQSHPLALAIAGRSRLTSADACRELVRRGDPWPRTKRQTRATRLSASARCTLPAARIEFGNGTRRWTCRGAGRRAPALTNAPPLDKTREQRWWSARSWLALASRRGERDCVPGLAQDLLHTRNVEHVLSA
jgi:hypothetical protein